MELSDFVGLRSVTRPNIDIEPVEIADISHRNGSGMVFRDLVYVQGIFKEVATKPVSSYIIGYRREVSGRKVDHVEILVTQIDKYDTLRHTP